MTAIFERTLLFYYHQVTNSNTSNNSDFLEVIEATRVPEPKAELVRNQPRRTEISRISIDHEWFLDGYAT
jgi:hypothetical protein